MKQRRGEYKSNKNIINKEIPPKKKKFSGQKKTRTFVRF